jgi:hypothetical protein
VSTFRAICRPIHHGDICWQEEFETLDGACEALEDHIESRSWSTHGGKNEGSVVELVNERTAKIAARHDYTGPGEDSVDFVEEEDKPELRRCPPDQDTVGDLVERGDKIEVEYSESYVSEGKVCKILEGEKYGIQVFSIIFVPVDVEPRSDLTYPDDDKKYLNNLVAQDGEINYLFKHRDDPIRIGDKVSGPQLDLKGFDKGRG